MSKVRLEVVGAGNIPDVYTQPFNNLKINAIIRIWTENNNHSIRFKVDNILDDLGEKVFLIILEILVFRKFQGRRYNIFGYSIKF